MTHHDINPNSLSHILEILTTEGFPGMAQVMELLFNDAMRIERDEFLRAKPHERTEDRLGYANGFKGKDVKTRVGELSLRVPQVRALPPDSPGFYPNALERGTRSEKALAVSLAEMYIQGTSTRKVMKITEKLVGFEVSSTQVSRVMAELDTHLQAWRERPLAACPFIILDARYEKVRHGGKVIDCAVLWAFGVDACGKRVVLGASVSLSEAEVHWREFIESLQMRGLSGVRQITSDAHAGLRKALVARFTGVAWQRCQFHLQLNAVAYVPRISYRKQVAEDIRGVFNAPDRAEADRQLAQIVKKWQSKAPALAKWMEENIPEGLTVFSLPPSARRLLRTSNAAERVNQELRRRTRVATLFPNEASLLRLVTAILSEISDDWETGKCYLTMEEAGLTLQE